MFKFSAACVIYTPRVWTNFIASSLNFRLNCYLGPITNLRIQFTPKQGAHEFGDSRVAERLRALSHLMRVQALKDLA